MNNQRMVVWPTLYVKDSSNGFFVAGKCGQTVHSFGWHSNNATIAQQRCRMSDVGTNFS
jgi:hypothetical protein